MILLKIAWRNIWRNKVRSLVLITSIALGIMAGLATIAMSFGMNNSRTRDAIDTYISHIQIHVPQYKDDLKLSHHINQPAKVEEALAAENITAYTPRTITTGMASSANSIKGVQIVGIDPGSEALVTSIHKKIKAGHYFEETRRNPIVLGEQLAEKLKVKINNKVVLTFQDVNNEIVAAAFRVNGIYKTSNSKYDESVIFVDRNDLNTLIGENLIHEIAIMTPSLDHIDPAISSLEHQFPNLSVEKWSEVSPDLGYADEMMATTVYIFIGIILLAMTFGILNTMLMAVLERKREIGVLMAIGMNKLRVFGMIVYETIFLALVAGPTGLVLAWGLNNYMGQKGLDLSDYGEGMEAYGISTIIYPELEKSYYFTVAIMVVIMAILSSLYPAWKAVKLKPTESMRTV